MSHPHPSYEYADDPEHKDFKHRHKATGHAKKAKAPHTVGDGLTAQAKALKKMIDTPASAMLGRKK